ncbi:MAG: hypothetical protein KC619_26465 [Myxococcales bacterium]|nr:hypothetical protein [Myxococcales bacterium]
MTARGGAWLLTLALLLPSVARAQSVRLRESPCTDAIPHDVLGRLLSVELRGDGVAGVDAGRRFDRPAVADVELVSDCGEPLTVEVRVTDPARGAIRTRTVDLTGVPAALRVRLLALSTAELLRATWIEPVVTGPPPELLVPAIEPLEAVEASPAIAIAPPASPSPVLHHSASGLGEPTVAAPSRREARRPAVAADDEDDREGEDRSPLAFPVDARSGVGALLGDPAGGLVAGGPAGPLELGAEGALRFFPESGVVLATAGASFRAAVGEDAFVALGFGAGGASTSQGSLVAIPASVRFGVAFDLGALRVDLGPRLEVALAWAEGTSGLTDNERTAAAARASALAVASISTAVTLRATPELQVGLLGDVGWVLVEPGLGIGGPTASVALSARVR